MGGGLLLVVPVPDWAAAVGLGLLVTASTATMRVIMSLSRQVTVLEQQVVELTRSNRHLTELAEATARTVTRLETLAERRR